MGVHGAFSDLTPPTRVDMIHFVESLRRLRNLFANETTRTLTTE